MRIHDVFHVDRFKPFIDSPESLGRRTLPPPEPEIVKGKVEFEVEGILAHKLSRNKKSARFLIKWVGYDAALSGWEPLSNLEHCQDILREYCQKHDILFLLGEGVIE